MRRFQLLAIALLALSWSVASADAWQEAKSADTQRATQAGEAPPAETPPGAIRLPVSRLRQIKRLCVEDFEGGENARQLRAMLIDQVHQLGAFVITENPDHADAYLRGFAEDLVYREQFSRDENVTTRGSGSVSTGGYTRNRASVSQTAGASGATRDRSETRRHEAMLTVRIVNASGDVLWSGFAESKGGKFRSAAADVTARIAASLGNQLQPEKPSNETRP